MKVVPLGSLTNCMPDEWKHPIGMPAGETEGSTMSVTALVGDELRENR